MKRIIPILLYLLSLALTGCEKADKATMDPYTNLDALWTILDEKYCFFEYKDIDWDEVYAKYRDQIKGGMNQYELFDLLAAMLNELKDGHVNLVSKFDRSRYWDWYEQYPLNFYAELKNHYLGTGTDYKIAGSIEYRTLAEGKVGYAYYGSFASIIGNQNLDYFLYYFKDCDGLIIDIRNNGGGSLAVSDRFASHFYDEKRTVGYIQHKTGKGHSDFSKPYPIEMEPAKGVRWLKPVIILTNRHCYSAANDFVNKMKLLPHVTIVGDMTGGGSGLPFSSEIPNGWSVRFSSSPILDAHMQHTEFGIEPDIALQLKEEDIANKKDTYIEFAIQHILDQASGNKE